MIINAAYIVTGAIAAFASLSSRTQRDACWWLILSIGLLALALFRIAEAGVWVDDYLRHGLHVIGWYDHRRPLQVICIGAFALGLILARSRLSVIDRSSLVFATGTFCVLVVFAAIRSSSLHWTDAVLGESVGSVTLSHAIQVLLLLAISAAAFVDLRSRHGEEEHRISV